MSKRPIPNQEAASFVGKHSVAFLLPDRVLPEELASEPQVLSLLSIVGILS
jgi:hypothetical protein